MNRWTINIINSIRLIGLLACGCVPFAAHGDALPDLQLSTALESRPYMTLAELTNLALRNNPSTREAWAAANAQAAAVGVAEAEYWPTLDAAIALTRDSTSGSSGGVSGTTQTRLTPGISLGYVLFDFGARSSSKEAAGYNLLAANLAHNRALQDVVLRVEQAYYQLLGASQTIVAGEETLKNVQMSFDVANARRQAGLATIGDVYQAETLLAQSRLQLRRAQGEASKLKGALCNAVGLPVNTRLELAPLEAQLPTQAVHAAVDDYLAKAKAARPDLGAAEAQSRAARANIEAASAQGRPSLELAIGGSKSYNNFQTDRFDNSTSNGSIGITLNIPLFDGFKTTNTVRQAQARAEQLDATRDRVALQVEMEVWQAYYDLDTSEATIDSAHALLRSASQAREVAQARYQAGVGDLPGLLLAQANEADARMQVIQAEMGWYASLSQLNHAIGNFSSGMEMK